MAPSQTPEPGTERTLRSSVRNPRRRQRQSDNDSLKASAPRRKRSKLSEETFKPRPSTETNDVDGRLVDGGDVVMNGHPHPVNGTRRTSETPMPNLDIPLRGKRSSVKRNAKHTAGQTLAKDKYYIIKELVSTPKELKKQGLEYRGSLGVANHALAITHERATIWDYTANVASSNPRVFDLPFNVRPSDPLPIGALVPNSARTTEIGLVLVSATTGEVVYYESVDRAASLSLFNDRKAGVEGSVGKLSFSETVTDLIPAEHAGFVVRFSSGRIAQMTLSDSQGKASISSQFLKIADPKPGGLFGSIRGFLGSTYRSNLAAVHVRPLNTRGQIQAVAITESTEVLVWDLDWSGRSDYKGSIDFRDMLVKELKTLDAPEVASRAENLAALDFAILDKSGTATGQEVATVGAEQPLDLCVLLKIGSSDAVDYVLAELNLAGQSADVSRIDIIKTYHGPATTQIQTRPRLLIPAPGHTAFVTFQDIMVLVERQEPPEPNPEAQLHASYVQPEPIEEVIRLRASKDLAIQNISVEEAKGSQASCVAFVKSYGLIRLSAEDPTLPPSTDATSVKTKIEQAIFFGILQPDNIIDFSRKDNSHYQLDEVDSAALEISDEILRASTNFSNYISPSPTSLEQHLVRKAQALHALVSHIRQNYPVTSKSTMWRLLWDAERVAAGQQLWATFENHVASSSRSKRKATLMDELCTWFGDETFTQRKDLAKEDPVRRFFIGGLHQIEKLLANTRIFLGYLEEEKSKSPEDILRLVIQANDVWLKSLDTAFAFRSREASSYGISTELTPDGVLLRAGDYAEIPEFWTSTEKLVESTAIVAEMSRELSTKFFENEALQPIIMPLTREIAIENPRLIELFCVQSQEAIRWRASRPSDQDREYAIELQTAFDIARYEQLRSLAAVGQADAGMQLAEKYYDMHTLTDMILAEDQYLDESMADATPEDKISIQQGRAELEQKVARLFKVYGDAWANPFFDKAFSSDRPGFNFVRAQLLWTDALGKYLRADPSRSKLCWINDVTDESDFTHASTALTEAAKKQERHLWAKKVELSMSKLALLAAEEGQSAANQPVTPLTGEALMQAELAVVDVQDSIYKHIRPDVQSALDRQAAPEVLLRKYGNKISEMSSLRQLLENGLDLAMDNTVLSTEELIDVLTLIDSVENDDQEDDNIDGAEFVLALTVLDAEASTLPASRFETLLQLIWKRCYIYDDWASMHLSRKQSDHDRKEILRHTAAWRTFFHAQTADLFARSASSSSAANAVRVLPPSECLGAGCAPEDLSYRFPDEDLRDPILHDNRLQDELLQSYVTDRQLDELVDECLRDAKEVFEMRRAELADFAAREKEFEDGFVEEVEEPMEGVNGHGYEHANGHVEVPNGAKAREFEEGGFEYDEDVEMSD